MRSAHFAKDSLQNILVADAALNLFSEAQMLVKGLDYYNIPWTESFSNEEIDLFWLGQCFIETMRFGGHLNPLTEVQCAMSAEARFVFFFFSFLRLFSIFSDRFLALPPSTRSPIRIEEKSGIEFSLHINDAFFF